MASLDFGKLGDIQKDFEASEAARAIMPGIPVLARLDGRGFHNFVKGLKRPFDERLSLCMKETTQHLLDKCNAKVAYTQSDEITLCWPNPEDEGTKLFFGGKFQKLCSVIAAMCSVRFNKCVELCLPDSYGEKEPLFDCRVWQVPNLKVAADNFLWREMDARKNSVSMAASTYLSHSELLGKSTKERITMLESKSIDWAAYPEFFKKGTYYRRTKRSRFLTHDELMVIPEAHRPVGPIERTEIVELTMPKAVSILNFADVLFNEEDSVLDTIESPTHEHS